jgi:type II secretory pathway component PulJ
MKRKFGFSLVEVNLAIFVVAIGLLTLFSLFPAGLKEGEAGHADTQTAMFADYVLATVRANALAVDSDQWGTSPNNIFLDNLPDSIDVGRLSKVEFPRGSRLYVRYYLQIARVGDNYAVKLWIKAGEYGTKNISQFKSSAKLYYTELFYSGMPGS